MSQWLGGFAGPPIGTIEAFREWLSTRPKMFNLQLLALHNTGAPNIAQTNATPGGYDQRQRNIGAYYRNLGWRGGPFADIYPDGTIREGTPWPYKGIHSPSWNDTGIGIEMTADFRPGADSPNIGAGLLMVGTAAEMFAAILRHQGLPLNNDTIKFHKEDPSTTHDCPGSLLHKNVFMAKVQVAYEALRTPGEHNPNQKFDDQLLVVLRAPRTPHDQMKLGKKPRASKKRPRRKAPAKPHDQMKLGKKPRASKKRPRRKVKADKAR